MPQERLYRTEGLVLREMNYAEADRILTLITPDGKLSVLAKGIRRPTSRKAGHLGLFDRARILVAKGRNLDIVTQAESLEQFEGLHKDLLRFTYACYAGELTDRLAEEEEGSRELYELLLETLRRFDTASDLALWARYFEMRLLSYSGYQPNLFRCVSCGREIVPETNYLSAEVGGLLCSRCGPGVARAIALSINAQKVLRYLQTHGAEEVATLRLNPATHAEVEAALLAYLEYILERELKSASFLQRLRRDMRIVEGQRA
ncbi:MAG: DNA repair protein RecO [Anaerolineae bacterium]